MLSVLARGLWVPAFAGMTVFRLVGQMKSVYSSSIE
jgi:hypothetical protein